MTCKSLHRGPGGRKRRAERRSVLWHGGKGRILYGHPETECMGVPPVRRGASAPQNILTGANGGIFAKKSDRTKKRSVFWLRV